MHPVFRKTGLKKIIPKLVLFIGIALFLWASATAYYGTTAKKVLIDSGKAAGYLAFTLIYHRDIEQRNALVGTYKVGLTPFAGAYPETWKQLDAEGTIKLINIHPPASQMPEHSPPFVYETPFQPYLKRLFELLPHQTTSLAHTEFERMKTLSQWIGTRWDHGTDPIPGAPKDFDPVQVIEAGARGKKFWCEIAAEVSVHGASACGWPARLVTLSRDGYTWEHAVAEYWSNQFNKWFVVDTDFNIIYMADHSPLSAFELCHRGEELQNKGNLDIIRIAPSKPGMPFKDLIPFYRYVHIDMRNDWYTRKLEKGSPAGGDLSTWWTARGDFPSLLTVKKRMDNPIRFDWPMNFTRIHALEAVTNKSRLTLKLGFSGYSPFFTRWQISIDQNPWRPVSPAGTISIEIGRGRHKIRARMVLIQNNFGPESEVCFNF